MNVWKKENFKRLVAFLLTVLLAVGCLPWVLAEEAEEDPLKPEDLVYEGGNIVLHKQAERVDKDKWQINVQVSVAEMEVAPKQLEVVIMLDRSGSMDGCPDGDAHSHLDDKEHTEDCYSYMEREGIACGKEEHAEHTIEGCYVHCTKKSNGPHWGGNGNKTHIRDTNCILINDEYYYLDCDKPFHTHSDDCHGVYIEHVLKCIYEDHECESTRLEVAKKAANQLITELEELEADISRYAYDANVTDELDAYDNSVQPGSGTKTYTALGAALNAFSDPDETDKKQVLILLTDGAADDAGSEVEKSAMAKRDQFVVSGGTIYTVGFNYSNDRLAKIASADGGYMSANNVQQLFASFEEMEESITAMLEDPMGTSVSFDVEEIKNVHANTGTLTTTGDTIYWHPEGGSVSDSVISYTYEVRLNDRAQLTAGSHSEIELNEPTFFKYGIVDGEGNVGEMKIAAFPIPKASYQIATLEVQYKCGNQTIGTPPEMQIIFPDYGTPVFSGEYLNRPGVIDDKYYFNGTIVVTKDGSAINENGKPYTLDDIDSTDASAYVVEYQYEERQEAPELFTVSYQFANGFAPEGVSAPSAAEYMEGIPVTVAAIPDPVEGYTFTGWKAKEGITDEAIAGSIFSMPANNVVLEGTWTKQPAYIVQADYYLVEDGEEKRENAETVQLALVYCADDTETSYTITDADRKYTVGDTEQSYTTVELAEGCAYQLNEDGTAVFGITPAAGTYPVVHLNFYRYKTTTVPYRVIHEYYVVDPKGNEKIEPGKTVEESFTGNHGQTVTAEETGDATYIVVAKKENGYTYVESNPEKGIVLNKNTSVEDNPQTITLKYVRYLYSVTYQWEGTEQPEDVVLPEEAIYSPDVSVNVAAKPSVEGWSFDGWRVQSGLTESIDGGSFTMPANNVVLVGTWTKQPAYIVQADYYLVEDGEEKQENEKTVQLAQVYCTDEAATSYSIADADYKYTVGGTEQSYADVKLKEDSVGTLNAESAVVSGIAPAADTYPVVHLNFYRYVNNTYDAIVRYVDANDTENQLLDASEKNGIGYGTEYQLEYNSAETIEVKGKEYQFVGDDTEVNQTDYSGLMPAKDFVITRKYQLKPSYQVKVEYYTITDGDTQTLDGTAITDVIFTDINRDLISDPISYSIPKTNDGLMYDARTELETTDKAELNTENTEVIKIIPDTNTTELVVKLYRNETTTVPYRVIHEYYVLDPDEKETIESDLRFVEDGTGNHGQTVALEQNEAGTNIVVAKNENGYTYVESDPANGLVLNKNDSTVDNPQTITLKYVRHLYSVTYQWEGNELPEGVMLPEEAIYSPDVSVNVAAKPSEEGWSFDGWRVQSGLTESIDDGSFTMPANNVVLVGSWTEIPKYSVTYIYDETAPEGAPAVPVDEVKYYAGTKVEVKDKPSFEGYTFTGWTPKTEGVTIEENTFTMPAEDVVLVGSWTEIPKYSVTYIYDETAPEGAPAVPVDEVKYYAGTNVEVKDKPSFEGYTFTGWTPKTEGVTIEGNSFTMPAKDVVLVGSWTEIPKYSVTYIYDETAPEGAPAVPVDEVKYYAGKQVEVKPEPSIVGYTFTGWTPKTEGVTITENTFTMPAKDVVLVGSWTEIPKYSVTYIYDETAPEGAPAVPVDEEKYYAGKQAEVMPKPSMVGYTFTGWTPKTEGVTISNNTFTMPAKNVVFVGSWAKQPSYQITVEYYTITDGVVPATPDETFISEVFYRKDIADVGTYIYSETAPENRLAYTDDAELAKVGSGATLNATTKQLTGIVPAEDTAQVVVKLYRKVNHAYQATVRYQDANGNTLSSDVTSAPIAYGQPYDLTALELPVIEVETAEGKKMYRFDHDDCDDNSTAYTGAMPARSFTITRVYVEVDTAIAVVRYVDENGQPLREDLMSAPVYVGEQYNVSEAKAVDVIVQGNKEYQFKYHYQQRYLVRSMGGLMAMNGDEYAGPMPAGGVIITRVYELSKETYYYQQKYVFTAYDANGEVVYSASEVWDVASTEEATATIIAPETYSHEGYGFKRKSEEIQTADLTGTTADRPHVFVVEYEMHEGDEPVPDTQLPPGLTPPQESSTATDAPVADLPPQTGDDGVALYLVLMLCAAAGLAVLIADNRKRRS